MRLVYVAGPLRAATAWEREGNIRLAEHYAHLMVEHVDDAMPVVPHAIGRFFDGTGKPLFWLEGTLELMRRCDAVLVLPGWRNSLGTKGEIREAKKLKIPIVYASKGWMHALEVAFKISPSRE